MSTLITYTYQTYSTSSSTMYSSNVRPTALAVLPSMPTTINGFTMPYTSKRHK